MLTRVAVLVGAVLLAGKIFKVSAETPAARAARSPSAQTLSHSAANQPASAVGTVRKRRTRRRRSRRRWRRYGPWRVSSFGAPGAFDDPTGEDPAVRQLVLEALGTWNGAVVVVDPNTGRLLSIVNQRVAFQSAFTPCSTFKPVVALAALKENIITAETEFRLGRRTRMNVVEALAHSNNPFFTRLGLMLGFDRVAKYARDFGLGEKIGANVPDEVPGRFPSESPKRGGVGFMASYGMGIEVTLLQMAAVVSAIANGGALYELQYPRTPEEIAQFQPRLRRRLDDLAPYLPPVKEGLAAAVLYGTGRFAYDPQFDIYGKTGTCSENGVRLGWFVSYAGEDHPKYVVAVLLRGGRPMYGPHAAEIAGRLYRGLRQRELENAQAQTAIPFHGLRLPALPR